jgi:hypothetical protein
MNILKTSLLAIGIITLSHGAAFSEEEDIFCPRSDLNNFGWTHSATAWTAKYKEGSEGNYPWKDIIVKVNTKETNVIPDLSPVNSTVADAGTEFTLTCHYTDPFGTPHATSIELQKDKYTSCVAENEVKGSGSKYFSFKCETK